MVLETNFPRGGTIQKRETSESVDFGAKQVKKKKKRSNTDKSNETENKVAIEAISAELLTYKTIQEGMLLYGIIKHVDSISLKVSLPGRIVGKVYASSISDSYNKILKEFIQTSEKLENFKPLDQMYSIGQSVYTKVFEIKENDSKSHVEIILSFKPSDVHSNLYHENFSKGHIFNGAIEEIQDHGFVIETGVNNLRCFLPKENIEDFEEKDFSIGQLVCVKIVKLTQFKNASIAVCKMISDENKRRVKDLIDPRLEYLMPSNIVNFTITKILKDGLQGTIMNGNLTAYVNEHQLGELFTMPDEYEINSTLTAKILYVMPLSKLIYLSLKTDKRSIKEQDILKRGIILDASVHHHGTGGIIFQIENDKKAVLSFHSLKSNVSGNFDQDDLVSKYSKNSVHKIRIIDYDFVDDFYICTDNPKILNEKYFALEDCKAGEFVTVTVSEKDRNSGTLYAKLGNCNALMEKLFQSPQTALIAAENMKLKCRILGVNIDKNIVHLTNRQEYMKQNANILDSIKNAKIGKVFLGTIVKCTQNFFIVKFFAGIKGILYKTVISDFMPSDADSFSTGQTMSFSVLKREGDKLLLTLVNELFKVGDICKATVEHYLENGLEISINHGSERDVKGLIPVRSLTDYPDLNVSKLRTFISGQPIEVVCTFKNIYSIRDVDYFKENPVKTFSSLKSGDMLRGSIKNIQDEIVEVQLPIRNYNKLLRIHLKMILPNLASQPNVVVEPDQLIYVKILNKEPKAKALTVSAKLPDVWDGDFKFTGVMFAKYLDEIKQLKKSLKSQNDPLGKLKIGEQVSAVVSLGENGSSDCGIKLENGIQGIIKPHLFCAKYKECNEIKEVKTGDKIIVVILWIDYASQLVYCSNQSSTIKKVSVNSKLPESLTNKSGILGKVLLIFDNFVICSLKQDQKPITLVATRMHYNDFESSVTTKVIEGDFCRLHFIHEKYPIAIFEDTVKLWNKYKTQKRKQLEIDESIRKKRKSSSDHINTTTKVNKRNQNEVSKLELDSDSDVDMLDFENVLNAISDDETGDSDVDMLDFENVLNAISDDEEEKLINERTSKQFNNEVDMLDFENVLNAISDDEEEQLINERTAKQFNNEDHANQIGEENKFAQADLLLPGATDFWSVNIDVATNNSSIKSSSEDDDSENENKIKKKKRLSAAERFKAEKLEEARIRQIEKNYADINGEPENADQFDRLVLSDPNNSKNWIKYMVFYLQTTEIDKARAVAKRALKAISFREQQELLNVWIALLNLESNYGSKENFNDALKEALLCNDPLKIYMRVIEILTNPKKVQELIDVITTATKKFKENPDIWKMAASAFFQVDMKEKGQKLLHRSLSALPDREHVNVIVAFAKMNHDHRDSETAHTLMEQVLTSYPKRIDVWSQYVDMLIKDSLVEAARRTLERAVTQKIPLKKMRTLFKKFLEFEEKYGNETNILKVKELANNYVKTEI